MSVSGGTAALRAITAKVFDGNGVAPGDFIFLNPQCVSEPLSLRRTWCVVAGDDRLDESCFQSRASHQLIQRNSEFVHVASDRLHGVRSYHSTGKAQIQRSQLKLVLSTSDSP